MGIEELGSALDMGHFLHVLDGVSSRRICEGDQIFNIDISKYQISFVKDKDLTPNHSVGVHHLPLKLGLRVGVPFHDAEPPSQHPRDD